MARSPARTALTLAVLLASAPLALAAAQEQRIERGSAIGTPLPVGKVEPAPIAPPPYSDAEKAALAKIDAEAAKIDAEAAALGGLHTTLARQIHGLASLASWLFALAVLQLVVLGVQLLALRRMRRSAAQAPKAEASAAPAKGA